MQACVSGRPLNVALHSKWPSNGRPWKPSAHWPGHRGQDVGWRVAGGLVGNWRGLDGHANGGNWEPGAGNRSNQQPGARISPAAKAEIGKQYECRTKPTQCRFVFRILGPSAQRMGIPLQDEILSAIFGWGCSSDAKVVQHWLSHWTIVRLHSTCNLRELVLAKLFTKYIYPIYIQLYVQRHNAISD